MSQSPLRDAILAHYFDDELMVTKDYEPTRWSSGNNPLSTGQFYTMLAVRREADESDIKRFTAAADGLVVDGKRGLYSRNPGRSDLNSHDNYIGIAAASFLLGTRHRFDIYSWGRRNWWGYDNTFSRTFSKSWWESRHWRLPGVVPFYRLCANDDLGPLAERALNNRIRYDAQAGDVSGHCLTWLMVQVCKAKGVCRDGVDLWESHIYNCHGSMAIVLGEYYTFTHPFFTYNFEKKGILG